MPRVKRKSSAESPERGSRRRLATVYDAVAGRVGSNGFLVASSVVSRIRDTTSSSHVPLPPDEILFKQKNAPQRYEEDDIYWADRHLPPTQPLPDSDLLKSVHAYSSDFYAAAFGKLSKRDFKSMDETALLAFGILLEEAAADILGTTGDLAFTEGDDDGPSTSVTQSVVARRPHREAAPTEESTNQRKEDSPEINTMKADSDDSDAASEDITMGTTSESETSSGSISGHHSSIGHESGSE